MPPRLASALRALWTPEAGALAFTAVTGVILALEVQLGPHGIRPVVDERAYVEWARAIAAGRLLFDEPFYLDPLAAYVLGGLFAVSGGSLFFARLFYVALGVGTVALVGRLGRAHFGRREGALAMWLLALYGPHTFALGWVLKEALTVHLTAWALWLGFSVQREGVRPVRWGGLGLVAGLLVLCRGNYVPLMPFLGLWVLARAWWSKEAKALRRAQVLAFCAGVALPLLPVSAHNYRAARSLLPITVHGGANFWIGNNPEASGAYDHWPFSRANPADEKVDYVREAERRVGRALTLRENSDYWFKEGLRFWKEAPLAAAGLLAKKLWLLVHNYEIPDNYAFSCFRRHFTPVLWVLPLGFGWLVGLALWGGWLAARADRRAWFALGFSLLYGASVAAFFVFDRYRIPLCLTLALFAARALGEVWDKVRAGAPAALWRPAVPIAAVTALAFIPTPISRQQEARDAYCVAQAGMLLYSDGLTAEAAPLLEFGRAHGQAGWIEETMQRYPVRGEARPRP